jgi:hypothetical protein
MSNLPKNKTYFFAIICLLYGSSWAQSSLRIIGPVNFVSNRSIVGGRQLMDTVSIPPGKVLKIEGVGLSVWQTIYQTSYVYLAPINDYIIELDDIFLHSCQNNTASGQLYQKTSLPCWIGPGIHYLYFNNPSPYSKDYRLSVHGILFQTD